MSVKGAAVALQTRLSHLLSLSLNPNMSWMNLDGMNHGMVVGGEMIYFMFYISMALMHG